MMDWLNSLPLMIKLASLAFCVFGLVILFVTRNKS